MILKFSALSFMGTVFLGMGLHVSALPTAGALNDVVWLFSLLCWFASALCFGTAVGVAIDHFKPLPILTATKIYYSHDPKNYESE
jgi:hypothetical protein